VAGGNLNDREVAVARQGPAKCVGAVVVQKPRDVVEDEKVRAVGERSCNDEPNPFPRREAHPVMGQLVVEPNSQ